ncbi:hypothetical protein [Actinophytocola sediminis]
MTVAFWLTLVGAGLFLAAVGLAFSIDWAGVRGAWNVVSIGGFGPYEGSLAPLLRVVALMLVGTAVAIVTLLFGGAANRFFVNPAGRHCGNGSVEPSANAWTTLSRMPLTSSP